MDSNPQPSCCEAALQTTAVLLPCLLNHITCSSEAGNSLKAACVALFSFTTNQFLVLRDKSISSMQTVGSSGNLPISKAITRTFFCCSAQLEATTCQSYHSLATCRGLPAVWLRPKLYWYIAQKSIIKQFLAKNNYFISFSVSYRVQKDFTVCTSHSLIHGHFGIGCWFDAGSKVLDEYGV